MTVNFARLGHGPSARLVVDLGSIEDSYYVYPGGQSGDKNSPHYDDLLDVYTDYDEASQHYGYTDMYYEILVGSDQSVTLTSYNYTAMENLTWGYHWEWGEILATGWHYE